MNPNAIQTSKDSQMAQLRQMRTEMDNKLAVTHRTVQHLDDAVKEIDAISTNPTMLTAGADIKRIANAIRFLALANLEAATENRDAFARSITTIDDAITKATSSLYIATNTLGN